MPTLLQQHLKKELGFQLPFHVTRVNAASAAKLQYSLFPLEVSVWQILAVHSTGQAQAPSATCLMSNGSEARGNASG